MSSLRSECRAAWRLLRLFLHLLRGLALLHWRFPHWNADTRRAAKQRWSGQLLDKLGLTLRTHGEPAPSGTLLVCNHISWLDVFVLNAATPTHFVCKDEVRGWPLIGMLVERSETLFIARGSRAAAARSADAIRERLQQGDRVAVFPEGTTTNGLSLLPFRPALFQSALDAGTSVQPVALRYLTADGAPSLAPAYDADITLLQCMRAIALSESLVCELSFLPLMDGAGERRLASEQARNAIATRLELRADT